MNLAERWRVLPGAVWHAPADEVLMGFHYFKFLGEYDDAMAELNKPKK